MLINYAHYVFKPLFLFILMIVLLAGNENMALITADQLKTHFQKY